jgi:hypothetical protein
MASSAGGRLAAIALIRDQTRGSVQLPCCRKHISRGCGEGISGGHAVGASVNNGRNHGKSVCQRALPPLYIRPDASTRNDWQRRRGRRQTGTHRRASGGGTGHVRQLNSSHGASGRTATLRQVMPCRLNYPSGYSTCTAAAERYLHIWTVGGKTLRAATSVGWPSVCMLLAGRLVCTLATWPGIAVHTTAGPGDVS